MKLLEITPSEPWEDEDVFIKLGLFNVPDDPDFIQNYTVEINGEKYKEGEILDIEELTIKAEDFKLGKNDLIVNILEE